MGGEVPRTSARARGGGGGRKTAASWGGSGGHGGSWSWRKGMTVLQVGVGDARQRFYPVLFLDYLCSGGGVVLSLPVRSLSVASCPQDPPVLVACRRATRLLQLHVWNLNYWDKASMLVGEVEEPRKTFPKAVFAAVGLVDGTYPIPLLVGMGALSLEMVVEWMGGFFFVVGDQIGGGVCAFESRLPRPYLVKGATWVPHQPKPGIILLRVPVCMVL
ncbi:hypothetical protein [Oryza sativa Japonica Group]|uniref:Uncharacterized protein n=1 Tax=Oryza sativa subsp. japonica TaxID=39947 RepID=Q5ZAU8_ORYSJ|nr:hypothetical protein [Oryza sativa Japonica Group]